MDYGNETVKIDCQSDLDAFYYKHCSNEIKVENTLISKTNYHFEFSFANNASISLLWLFQKRIYYPLSGKYKKTEAIVDDILKASEIEILNVGDEKFCSLMRSHEPFFENKNEVYILLNVDMRKSNKNDGREESEFNMKTLHNCFLVACKYQTMCKGFIVNIQGDINRVKPYVQNLFSGKILILCNNILLEPDLNAVGKLPPAIFVTESDIVYLKKPLNSKTWKLVKGEKPLNPFSTIDAEEKRYWPYLRMIQKSFFEEFNGNKSKEYTNLRKEAYSSKAFFDEYVSRIPFLSLFLFALYDSYYRSDLLKDAKIIYQSSSLKRTDFLLSEQQNQDWERYKSYVENVEISDIKNLFSVDDRLSQTVIAEIFECVSVSEGLLQILDNAVKHAEGGLLSMRIYSRDVGLKTNTYKEEHHADYLKQTYSEEYLDFVKAKYYLEIHISDLYRESIPYKFIDNIKSNLKITEDSWHELNAELGVPLEKQISKNDEVNVIFRKLFEDDGVDLEEVENRAMHYFFDKNEASEKMQIFRQWFYNNPENLVHHYGLEIFTNILTARNGIFGVCGYSCQYNNLGMVFDEIYKTELKRTEEFSDELKMLLKDEIKKQRKEIEKAVFEEITRNSNFNGTNYTILFPLKHSPMEDADAILSDELEIQQGFLDEREVKACFIPVTDFVEKNKNEINEFADAVDREFLSSDFICFDFRDSDSRINGFFENLIKGIILFALKRIEEVEKKGENEYRIIPIALVNMTPFQMIDASRIIAIYYAKGKRPSHNPFERVPFYLRCNDNCKELIFCGKDIEEVKRNLIKTAMINGAMFEELATIVEIFRKEGK